MAEGGRFARQYVHTAGRTRVTGEHYPLETLVQRTFLGVTESGRQQPTYRRALDLVVTPTSIAELGAHLGVHAGIVRVVVGDLLAAGLVAVEARRSAIDGPDLSTLTSLLRELESLD